MADLSTKTPIEYLKGVGPQKAGVLKDELRVATIGDLLQHYPFRYIDRTQFHKIDQLSADMIGAQVIGRLVSLQEMGEKRTRRLVAQFRDDTGAMELVWFHSIAWMRQNLRVGSAYIIYGKPTEFNGRMSVSHPEMELYRAQEKKIGNMTMQPVYSSTEKLKKFQLDSKGILRLQQTALELLQGSLAETLPAHILAEHRLAAYPEALLSIHFPANAQALGSAVRRLKFEELFFIQLRLLRNKQLNTQKYKGHRFAKVGDRFNGLTPAYARAYARTLRILAFSGRYVIGM